MNAMLRRILAGLSLGFLLAASTGCTYLKYRGEDAMEIIDLGITVSEKPGFAFYYDFITVIPIGIGYVDGTFAGLGGGRFGWMKHYERSFGLVLWGQEEVGFREYDKEKPETLGFQRTGLIGVFQGPLPGPDYMISCPHYLHVGWIGVVGSPRYLQAVDFVLGIFGLDICFDDGPAKATWGGKSIFGYETPAAATPPAEPPKTPEPATAPGMPEPAPEK